jgi:transposase InsO family protein
VQQQQSSLSRKHVTHGLHQQKLGGISTDFTFPHLGWHFIAMDAYSKYRDITVMSSMTLRLAVAVLHQLFGQHGVSKMNVSDNGAQFTLLEFGQFCKANVIKHFFSLPHHPQSNGKAIHFVDTFNRGPLELKWKEVGHIADASPLAYNMTPSSTLPQQHCAAELSSDASPIDTSPSAYPTNQPGVN